MTTNTMTPEELQRLERLEEEVPALEALLRRIIDHIESERGEEGDR